MLLCRLELSLLCMKCKESSFDFALADTDFQAVSEQGLAKPTFSPR